MGVILRCKLATHRE